MEEKKTQSPAEGPGGVDRWTSNGYGLRIDGIEVNPPEEKEAEHGNQTQEHAPDKR